MTRLHLSESPIVTFLNTILQKNKKYTNIKTVFPKLELWLVTLEKCLVDRTPPVSLQLYQLRRIEAKLQKKLKWSILDAEGQDELLFFQTSCNMDDRNGNKMK